MTDTERELRKVRKYLRELTRNVSAAITLLDDAMKGASTVERGRKVAAVCNALEFANDSARRFGLGETLKK